MGKNYGLTNTELELMELVWERSSGLAFKEIFDYFNNERGKGWKKQTLSTYLTQLQKAGLITVDTTLRNYVYYPQWSKDEHIQKWTQQLVEESFDNSISKFVAAFTGEQKLSQEEAEKLKELIDSCWGSDSDDEE